MLTDLLRNDDAIPKKPQFTIDLLQKMQISASYQKNHQMNAEKLMIM